MKKFCRKGHLKRSGKRWLALLMSVCLIGTMIPITARAENGSTETGLCEHHTEHTAECGYVAPVRGHECEHVHDESCGYQEASECNHVHTEKCGENGENCTHVHTSECGYAEGHACEHVHDEECGYVEASEGSPCTFVCDICGEEAEPEQATDKLITTWQWIDEDEYLDEETGNLALPGASEQTPAYFDDVTALLPTQILATVENTEDTEAEETEETEETITIEAWDCDSYPQEGAYQGSYTFTAALPEGYALSEEAESLEVLVELGGVQMYGDSEYVNGFCTDYAEDSSCSTHDNCNGYQPAEQVSDTHHQDLNSTHNGYYAIENAGQLYWFAALVNGTDGLTQNLAANAVLTDNITVNTGVLDENGDLNTGDFRSWTPIGGSTAYTGIFDGDNKTISGLYYNVTSSSDLVYAGLFGRNAGTIKNVGIVDSYFELDFSGSRCGCGSFCGFNAGTIENCHNKGAVSVSRTTEANDGQIYVGGLCGINGIGTIKNCYNAGNVIGQENADLKSETGGVCGRNVGIITNCYNLGNVRGGVIVGGICGFHNVDQNGEYTIANCYNGGTVSGGYACSSLFGLNYAGDRTQNCYYLDTTGSDDFATAKTATQFASGEVAYLLSQGCTIEEVTYEGSVWKQNIDTGTLDDYPLLDSNGHGTVYASAPCPINFSNTDDLAAVAHIFEMVDDENHKCKNCGLVKVHSTETLTYTADENTNEITVKCGDDCGKEYGTVTLSAPTENLTYDGNAKTASVTNNVTGVTISDPTITYSKTGDETFSGTPKDAGTYTASITLGDATVSVEFTIEKAPMSDIASDIAVTTYSGSYDGESHTVVGTGGITGLVGSDNTIYYSTDNKATWSTTVPTITDADTLDFHVKVTKPNYEDWISEKQTAEVTPVALDSSMISFNNNATGIYYYTGQEVKPGITVNDGKRYLVSGTDYTVSYTNNTSVSADNSKAKVTITAANGNYTGSASAEFTIEYAQKEYLDYCTVSGTEGNDGWYTSDVTIQNKTEPNSEWGALQFSGSPTGTFADSYTVSAEGINNTTIWFKQTTTGYIGSQDKEIKIDKSAPVWTENGCGISVKKNWWKSLLNTISFGLFYKDATVDVNVCAYENLSGIEAYYYYIDTSGSTEVMTASTLDTLSFARCDAAGATGNVSKKLTGLSANGKYVVYAYAVDIAGNRSGYVCTDGVVRDTQAPTITDISTPDKNSLTLTDQSATLTFTGSEAGKYFYMVKESSETAPVSIAEFATEQTNEGYSTWTAKQGVSYAAMTADGSNTVILTGLNAYTEYTLYLAAVDQAGNSIQTIASKTFTTCKTMPTVAAADMPKISGTYGQTVENMTLTPGTAKVGNTVITGAWTVTDSGKTDTPSVGTTNTYQVTFTPDTSYNGRYDTKIVPVKPTVAPRSLTADDVSITEVADSFTYGYGAQIEPSVTFGAAPATGASGVYVTDSGATITTADIKVTYSNNINAGTAKVILTGQGNYTGTVERTFTIDKADGKNIATMNGSYTDNGQTYTYTVEAVPADGADVSGLEYLMLPQGTALTGSETWQTSNVFAGITPNTVMVFYARMKATSNNHAGAASSKTVNFEKLTPSAPALNYTVDDSNPNSIALMIISVPGAEYSFDGGSSFTDDNTKGGLTADTTINLAIRMKETDTHKASEATKLSVTLTAYDITVSNGSAAVNGNTVTKGYPGQTVTVTAANRSGYNVTGWTVVSGGVTLSVSTDKKTATFTMPEETVSLKAEYRKNDSSSGGDSGNSGGSSGGGSSSTGDSGNTGDSTDTGNGNTNPGTEKPPVTPGTPAQGTNPVPGENPAPGTGNNNKPGSKPVTNTGETTEAPFIKGENGKEGWDVIRDEVNQTQEGKTVIVDMNGSTVVPGDVLDEIKGKDITIVFDMGGGITWSVNGQSITADRVSDIDFTVKTGTNTIPADIINNVTGERYSTQISLAYEGEFGFTAVLSINVAAENAGLYANLFYFNEKTGELEFICYDEIATDGTAELVFTHASDYAIVIDTEPMDKGADEADGDKEEVSGTGNDSTQSGDGSTQNGTEAADSTWNPLWLLLIGTVVIVIGLGVFLVRKKKAS